MSILSFFRKKRVGLALGGGAARGIAHIGVLKVLVENKIPIHFIAGTSSGALFGALLSGGMSIDEIETASRRAGWSRLVRLSLSRRGAISADAMEKLIIESIGDRDFNSLGIPLSIVATDLRTGEQVVIKEGSVARAVHASSAVPGVFVPVEIGDKLLADGMIVNNVPVDVVKDMGANIIIAVDVIPRTNHLQGYLNMVQAVERAVDLGIKFQSQPKLKMADFVIEPVSENIGPFGLDYAPRLIRMGEEAAREQIDRIKRKVL